jgi:hypothetical protein
MSYQLESHLIKGWYYLYTPDTGTDPLTVILQRKPLTEGRMLLFPSGVLLLVEIEDHTNYLHPYIICDIIDGDIKRMETGVQHADTYNLQRIENRGNRTAYASWRRFKIRWQLLRCHRRRLLRRLYGASKENRLDGDTNILLWSQEG